jgi:hypothetical protein
MNATTQLAFSSMLAATGGSNSRTFDVAPDQELYAIWKSVFERAKPVEISHQPAPAAGAHAGTGRGNFLADADDRSALPSAATQARFAAVPAGSSTDIRLHSAAGADVSANHFIMDTQPEVTTVTPGSNSSEHVENAVAARQIRSELQSAAATVEVDALQSGRHVSMRRVSAELPSADSIHVFVRDAAVAIVVRDAEISQQQALHCAFETARKLTGQRAALQQLVLNGRTLYQHGVDTRKHDSTRSASLVFAC